MEHYQKGGSHAWQITHRLKLASERAASQFFFAGPAQHGLIIIAVSIAFGANIGQNERADILAVVTLGVALLNSVKRLVNCHEMINLWGSWQISAKILLDTMPVDAMTDEKMTDAKGKWAETNTHLRGLKISGIMYCAQVLLASSCAVYRYIQFYGWSVVHRIHA